MPNRTGASVTLASGLAPFVPDLSLVICDLWGVMHDGVRLYKAAENAMRRTRAMGVKTVFLSNAPRPRTHVRQHLLDMGLAPDLTDFVVTSGGLARDEVRNLYQGARLYHIGPKSDSNTIEGLPVTLVDHPDEADIILATDLDFPSIEEHRPWLRDAAMRRVPFLCANPDRVVHVGSRLYSCAGAVADLYTQMGGPVHWFGKPTAAALKSCLKEVGLPMDTPGAQVLMIGDSLQTDMAGAAAAGFRGLFVAGGIHREDLPGLRKAAGGRGDVPVAAFTEIFGAGKAVPHAVIDSLCW